MTILHSVMSHVTLQNFLILANATGTICTMIVFFWSRLPKARKDWYEKNTPKFANTMRLLAAIFSDVMKAKRAYGKIKSGKVWREEASVLGSTPANDKAPEAIKPHAQEITANHRKIENAESGRESSDERPGATSGVLSDASGLGHADRRDGQANAGDASIFDVD